MFVCAYGRKTREWLPKTSYRYQVHHDIGMSFRLDKCGRMVFNKGKIRTEEVDLPEGVISRTATSTLVSHRLIETMRRLQENQPQQNTSRGRHILNSQLNGQRIYMYIFYIFILITYNVNNNGYSSGPIMSGCCSHCELSFCLTTLRHLAPKYFSRLEKCKVFRRSVSLAPQLQMRRVRGERDVVSYLWLKTPRRRMKTVRIFLQVIVWLCLGQVLLGE